MRYYLILDAEENCIGLTTTLFLLYHTSERLRIIMGQYATTKLVSRPEYETFKAFGIKEYVIITGEATSSSKPL